MQGGSLLAGWLACAGLREAGGIRTTAAPPGPPPVLAPAALRAAPRSLLAPSCREKVIPEATAWFTGEALLEYEVRGAGRGWGGGERARSAGWAPGCVAEPEAAGAPVPARRRPRAALAAWLPGRQGEDDEEDEDEDEGEDDEEGEEEVRGPLQSWLAPGRSEPAVAAALRLARAPRPHRACLPAGLALHTRALHRRLQEEDSEEDEGDAKRQPPAAADAKEQPQECKQQ